MGTYKIKTERTITTVEVIETEVTLAQYIGGAVKEAREKKGYNVAELARNTLNSKIKASGTIPGVSAGTILRIEEGEANTNMNTLEILADILDIHITDLFPPKEFEFEKAD